MRKITNSWRSAGLAMLAAAFCLTQGSQVRAETWPSRPVTMLVAFGPGATVDVIARKFAADLGTTLGQRLVVENKGGAGGNIGATSVARATPDGYTVFFATTSQAATNKLMYKHMDYDPQRDFTPVALVAKAPVFISARSTAPYSSLKDFIAYAKANPNKVTAGFPGNGTLGYITGELLSAKAGITFGKTQYRGTGAILTDLIGGHIDIAMDSMAPYVPLVRDGKIKALAIASLKRWPKLPDVPTVAESGLPGFEASVWYAILVPAKTPADVVNKLNAATNTWLAKPETKEFLANLGVETAGGTPADLKAFTQSEIDKWGPIIKAAGISF